MAKIKRFIRPSRLEGILHKGLSLFGEDASLWVRREGEDPIGVGSCEGCGLASHRERLTATAFLNEQPVFELILIKKGLAELSRGKYAQIRASLDFVRHTVEQCMEICASRRAVAEEALSKYRELAMLDRAIIELNGSLKIDDVGRSLMSECTKRFRHAHCGCLFLLDEESRSLVFSSGFGEHPEFLTPITGSLLALDVMMSRRPEIVNDMSSDARWSGEASLPDSMILAPLVSIKQCFGLLILASPHKHTFQSTDLKHLVTLASIAGIALSNARHFEDTQILMQSLMRALAEAIDARDSLTAGHSERVALLSRSFASALTQDDGYPEITLNEDMVEEIYYSAILHDVGKIGVREEVLNKDARLSPERMRIIEARLRIYGRMTGFPWESAFARLEHLNQSMVPDSGDQDFVRELACISLPMGNGVYPLIEPEEASCLLLDYGNLTWEEREEIMRHPAESKRILQHIPFKKNMGNLTEIIFQHHERLNGSGYPRGIRGDEILMQSRLIAIVDIYDAVTQKRHYKPAISKGKALQILRVEAESGKLDARLVDFFCSHIDTIERQAEIFRHSRKG